LLEKKEKLLTDLHREKKLFAEGMNEKLLQAEDMLKKAQSHCAVQRLCIVALAHGQTLSESAWQIFTRWAYYVSAARSHKTQVALLLFPQHSRLLQDIVSGWHSILRCTGQQNLTFRIVESRSEEIARCTVTRLSLVFYTWRHAAAFAEKMQAAATFRTTFPLRTALSCILRLRRVQLAGSLWRWRQSAKRDLQKEEKQVAFGKCRMEETLSSRRQLADLGWKSIYEDAQGWNLLKTCLSSWIWSAMSPRLSERRASLQEVQRKRFRLAAVEGQACKVRKALAALVCASYLSQLLCRKQRTALKCWRFAKATNGIFGELEAAQSSAALLALNRRCLEDWFVRQHHAVLGARQAAQEVAAAWALYLEKNLFRRAIVAWRVGSLVSQSERRRQWQDMQRKAEGDSAELEKQEAIRAKAAEVLFCSSAEQLLPLILKRWRRLAFKEKRSREVELLRQQSQARLQEQQRKLEQAQLATARYRNHAFASCFVTSAVGSANWLRIFLWDWKRAVTSSTSIKILRLWYVVAAMEIFKCKRWLLEFCLRLWAALVRIPLMRKAQAQLQPILVLHEEASIESRIIAGESFLLQYVVICTWRRFLRAELLKLEVKQVCREWNSEEEQVARTLDLVQQQISRIWVWADLCMRRFQAREDLRDAILAWAQVSRLASQEAHLRKALEEAQMGPQVQQHLESIVCIRWRQRSLTFHDHESQHSCLASSFLAWRMAGLHERAMRRRTRSRDRAVSIVEQWTGSCHLQAQRLVFDGWQTVLCSARQRWLDKRRSQLQQMLQWHFPGSHAASGTQPQLHDQEMQQPSRAAASGTQPQLHDQEMQQPSRASPAASGSQPQSLEMEFAAKLRQFTFGLDFGRLESLAD